MEPGATRIGQHVIAIGYPLSASKGALYDGFINAKYPRLPVPMAIVNGRPIYPAYDVIGVQMPLTPGADGGPMIADNGDVIGVITGGPVTWFNDLNALVQRELGADGGLSEPTSDPQKLVARLAWVVQEFATSGAGFAVPVSYLERLDPNESPAPPAKKSPPESRSRRGWFRALLDRLK
jgi:S1-C subfamily serine protease